MRDKDSIGKVLMDVRHGAFGYWNCGEFTCIDCPAKVDGETPRERYGVDNCTEAIFADAERRIRELLPDADALRGVAERLDEAADCGPEAPCSWRGCIDRDDCDDCPDNAQLDGCDVLVLRDVAREIRKALHDAPDDAPDDAPESAQEAACGPKADGPGQVPGSGVADAQRALELSIVRAQRDVARADLADARVVMDGLRAEVGRLTAERDADRAAVLAKHESLKDTEENLTSDMSLTSSEYAKKFGFYCTALDCRSLECAMLAHLRWRRAALKGVHNGE